MENTLIATLTGAGGYSQRSALNLIGLSRSAFHYRSKPRPKTNSPVPHCDRNYPNRIDEASAQEIRTRIDQAWGKGLSVGWAFADAWDEGVMLGSQRSWWRIANTIDDQQSRPVIPVKKRNAGKRPPPQVLATAPGQAWVWDITDLNSPFRGLVFKAYVIEDLFSRKIVGYRIEEREVDALAVEMFQTAFTEHGEPGLVHSDSGAAMTSNVLTGLFADRGVTHSRTRPRVSNDNAHKESAFRTLKYRPGYPGTFDTIDDARAWFAGYVDWYNTSHHHTGLALYTPGQVHDGTWRHVHAVRQQALDAYYDAHPERFRRRPHVKTPAEMVGINPPRHNNPETAH